MFTQIHTPNATDKALAHPHSLTVLTSLIQKSWICVKTYLWHQFPARCQLDTVSFSSLHKACLTRRVSSSQRSVESTDCTTLYVYNLHVMGHDRTPVPSPALAHLWPKLLCLILLSFFLPMISNRHTTVPVNIMFERFLKDILDTHIAHVSANEHLSIDPILARHRCACPNRREDAQSKK